MNSEADFGADTQSSAAGERLSHRFPVSGLEILTVFIVLAVAVASYFIISDGGQRPGFLTPALMAGLLVANLAAIMTLIFMIARRVARGRAARSIIGGTGRMHIRLVAIFSVIASIPTLLVVIFASLLFQYGVEFWFSDRARTVLENADKVAGAYVKENRERIIGDIVPMAMDIRAALRQAAVDDPRFGQFFAQQVAYRVIDEAAIIEVTPDGTERLIGGANLDNRPLEERFPKYLAQVLNNGQAHVSTDAGDRVESVILLDQASHTYLYVSRRVDPIVLSQVARAQTALSEYKTMILRSRSLQLRFNAALILVSLVLLAAVIVSALKLADRLVRPVGELIDAARNVAAGDFSGRLHPMDTEDELGILALNFNRMTSKLQAQTDELVSANTKLDQRRALTEAVLSGVSAGVISINREGIISLINASAVAMLGGPERAGSGIALEDVSQDLWNVIGSGDKEAVVQLEQAGMEQKTLAVRVVTSGTGLVLTFDDITQQLTDQRRAAWADVARRIAHEIKNPLTPIQLAAERLQRRFGRNIGDGAQIFEQLTGTIVRQVGDLRRMVDEFSSFARMPKPIFRQESLTDIVRQSVFLHEVAHPAIAFATAIPDHPISLTSDRRQLGQAFTNIVKNAVEAIEERGEGPAGQIFVAITEDANRLIISISDNGVGLPADRERITEPYMTTRARGTGLGLAIVSKIIEEHLGTISFSDRDGGGTCVTIIFTPSLLDELGEEGAGASLAANSETTHNDRMLG